MSKKEIAVMRTIKRTIGWLIMGLLFVGGPILLIANDDKYAQFVGGVWVSFYILIGLGFLLNWLFDD